jgi:hypothetical protein
MRTLIVLLAMTALIAGTGFANAKTHHHVGQHKDNPTHHRQGHQGRSSGPWKVHITHD